jgi:hypothetical protein
VGYFPITTGRSAKFGTGRQTYVLPDAPDDFPGTRPEWLFLQAHIHIGRFPGEHFAYQYDPTGSDSVILRVDFFEFPENIAIEVLGFFDHYVGYDPFQRERDQSRTIFLESIGIPVINVDAEDVERDPVEYLRLALRGLDLSKRAQGVM